MFRMTVLVIVCWTWAFALAPAAGMGPNFLVRLDLGRRADFDRAATLNLESVYRWGNEFYVVVDGSGLGRMDALGLKYRVIDRDPFAGVYYYIDATSPIAEKQGVTRFGAQALDQIGGATLFRSEHSLTLQARLDGEGPVAITGERIPLTYKAPLTIPGTVTNDPILDTVIAHISQDSILAYAARLVSFRSRFSFTDSNLAARDWLIAKFQSFGYANTVEDTFIVYGSPSGNSHNVICTKTGAGHPETVVLIGAHYDDMPPWSYSQNAPGADDNASGVAAVLEIARVLAPIPTQESIVFVAFGAEEQGLYGSDHYSAMATSTGMNLHLMFNMDMIGYNPDAYPDVCVTADPASLGYALFQAQIADAKTSLVPIIDSLAGYNSDHYFFMLRGFHFTYSHEAQDNPRWHQPSDSIVYLNPTYWTEAVRMVGGTAYLVARGPDAVRLVALWDVGDGSSLELRWQRSTDVGLAGYRVYWGESPGVYTHTLLVSSPAATSARLNALTPGVSCYASVAAVDSSGTESAARSEVSLAPYLVPRVPTGIQANIELNRIELYWSPTVELDFDHFAIYRGTDSSSMTPLFSQAQFNLFTDVDVNGGVRYYYAIVAVDHTHNTSARSAIVSGIPATFARGVLIADLTAAGPGNPSETDQSQVYNSVLSSYRRGYYRHDDPAQALDKSELGRFNTLYWLDDDNEQEDWPPDYWSKLTWFLSYGNNLVVQGWKTPGEVASAGVLDDLFHVSGVTQIGAADCIGGIGTSGFPNVVFDTARVSPEWLGALPDVCVLAPADATADVVLTYHSATNDPAREMLAAAVRCSTPTSKTALIGLPLYYMRETDAIGLVTTLMNWFGTSAIVMGDVNDDGVVDVFDVLALIAAAFQGQPPSTGYAYADVNGDCVVDVLDVIYIIEYTFSAGTAPVPGCAQ